MNKMNKALEEKLWNAADALRGNISSEQYMNIVIAIMFLKYMSDKYDKAIELIKEKDIKTIDDVDILSKFGSPFAIPEKAHWNYISKFAIDLSIGEIMDRAFELIEEKNPKLKGLFDKDFNREELDQGRLGQVISEFANLNMKEYGEDIIGRTYEFFLREFFLKQGQKGGEFYTPESIVNLMVQIINPKHASTIYDPAAGTGGMLVQAKKHIELKEHKKENAMTVYGQEFQNKTWKLSKINLLLHGFDVEQIHLGDKSADTFTQDLHKNKEFDYIFANPPFNQKKWGLEKLEEDFRWQWGIPPKNNANYAWLSHMMTKLKYDGIGATVLANGSLSASNKSELNIRKEWIKNNKIIAIISLPNKLFYTTGIPACIWVFGNNGNEKILMVDASSLEGKMESKKLRSLTNENIKNIVEQFQKFQNNEDIKEVGFAKTVSIKEIEENDYSFVPGRYVGVLEEEIDKEQIKKEIKEASNELRKLFNEFNELLPEVEKSINEVLKKEN